MTPLDVIATIRNAGGFVVVETGSLKIQVPAGTLTAEHKQVLAEHKQVLIRLLASAVDPEREAIQWVDGLDPSAADLVLDQAVREWSIIVGDPVKRLPDLSSWRSYSTQDWEVFEAPDAGPGWREVPILRRLIGNGFPPFTLKSETGAGFRCDVCPSTEFVEVPVHNGRSTRRDCRRCGRFAAFAIWNGRSFTMAATEGDTP